MEALADRLVEHQDALVADAQAGGMAATWILLWWKFVYEQPHNELAETLLADLFDRWLVLDGMRSR